MRALRNGLRRWATAGKFRGAAASVAVAGLLAGTAVLSGPSAVAGSPQGAGVAFRGLGQQTAPRSGPAKLAPRHGRFLGIMPSGPGRFANRAGPSNGTPPLIYHGGPVQHGTTVYAIFWQPPGRYLPPSYQANVAQYFQGATLS